MKVTLAGYNVDREVLEELVSKTGPREDLTPETFSASYARISRDGRPIDEIRREARQEVERTRKSNQAIIFKMGHHSVAEHAVFNFDIINVSRFVMEEIERFRLASYTEKSQRYITLQGDFVVPDEIVGTPLEAEFKNMVTEQNAAYEEFFTILKKHIFNTHSDLAGNPKMHSLLEGWAKEDARYITPLATYAQVGLTVNARTLELMFRRFASHPLAEVRQLRQKMYDAVKEIAPSIIMFHEANNLDQYAYPETAAFAQNLNIESSKDVYAGDGVSLVQVPDDGDDRIAAALLHTVSDASYEACYKTVAAMTPADKKELFKTAFRHVQFYDTLQRELEYVNLTYEMVISAAGFGQLKRHRMATITSQKYAPCCGVTLPPSINTVGLEKRFREITARSEELYGRIMKECPAAAPYILTNAHRKRVLVNVNARELYHISRLREDQTAQWDIRQRTCLMRQAAQKKMPLTFMLISSKDTYHEVYEQVFGVPPKMVMPPQIKAAT